MARPRCCVEPRRQPCRRAGEERTAIDAQRVRERLPGEAAAQQVGGALAEAKVHPQLGCAAAGVEAEGDPAAPSAYAASRHDQPDESPARSLPAPFRGEPPDGRDPGGRSGPSPASGVELLELVDGDRRALALERGEMSEWVPSTVS